MKKLGNRRIFFRKFAPAIMEDTINNTVNYSEEDIKTLVWNEHIR